MESTPPERKRPIVTSLTTEVGPRLAGSEAEARAREWALNTLAERFGCSVGISDHTPGDLVPIASVSLGGNVIEKHVTFDRSLPGPDHSYAMTWEEFGAMVDRVRCLEAALGSGVKAPTEREKPRLHKMRRSPYDPITFRPSESADAVWLRPQTD